MGHSQQLAMPWSVPLCCILARPAAPTHCCSCQVCVCQACEQLAADATQDTEFVQLKDVAATSAAASAFIATMPTGRRRLHQVDNSSAAIEQELSEVGPMPAGAACGRQAASQAPPCTPAPRLRQAGPAGFAGAISLTSLCAGRRCSLV